MDAKGDLGLKLTLLLMGQECANHPLRYLGSNHNTSSAYTSQVPSKARSPMHAVRCAKRDITILECRSVQDEICARTQHLHKLQLGGLF